MGIELTNGQVFATYKGEDWWHKGNEQVFEVSGAAGTGKTTLILYLIERLGLDIHSEVLFVAYMGKAVSQLARHGLPAKTIHSAIYNYEKVPARDENGALIFRANGKVKMVGRFELKDHISKKIKLIVLDEGSTVDKKLAEDLKSFKIPIIVLGDLNQLPPPFGSPYFLQNPDVILTDILRQKEGDPIIWLSQQVLAGNPLVPGVYGHSAVIKKSELDDFHLKWADIVLTGTNWLRFKINTHFRENIKSYKRLDYPHIGEKVICRKNNWDRCIDDGIYLTNGTSGVVTYVERESYNGKSMKIDFKPDFSKSEIRNLSIDYDRLMTQNIKDVVKQEESQFFDYTLDAFEFAYAITIHSSQGSQWPNCLMMAEQFMSPKDQKKLLYTGITRASDAIIIVI